MITVDKRQLGVGSSIGSGGVGDVFEINNPVPGLPWPLVYKQVKDVLPPRLDRKKVLRQMRRIVELRASMSTKDVGLIDEVTVWPLAMVQDGGREVGILLKRIPDEFFINTNTKPAVFELQFLCASDKYLQARGIDRSTADDDLVRLALMARLAYAIEILHRHGLVYGDLNLKNAAVATQPRPNLLLMDCDGVADMTDTTRVQLHGPFFVPPEIVFGHQDLQDQQTDVFKLGLCVIRGLARGEGVTQCTNPDKTIAGLLDQEGKELLRRAVGARDQRPTAADIADYLVERTLVLADPPELLAADLDRHAVLRGSDVFVRWTQKGGQQVRILGVNDILLKDNLPADAPRDGVPVRPPTSGPIYVEVSSRQGDDRLLAGHVEYYELPAFHFDLRGVLPRLDMPELPEAQLPETYARLPDYPVFTTDGYPPPRFELPALGDYLDFRSIAPGTSLSNGPGTAIERTYVEANAGITAAVGDGMRRTVEAVHKDVAERIRDADAIADTIDRSPTYRNPSANPRGPDDD